MATDLAALIEETRLIDTHEHLHSEEEWVQEGPDVLGSLFHGYVLSDLRTAGAPPDAVDALVDAANPDVAARFARVAEAWRRVQFTGYGESVRLTAKLVYGLDEISPAGLEAAQSTLAALRRPGGRLSLLRDAARLDHVQIDNFALECPPDPEDPGFFLYDMAWVDFSKGAISPRAIASRTGIEVKDLKTLDEALQTLFEKYGPCAVAVKSQHAYDRTLAWREREPADVEAALGRLLKAGAKGQGASKGGVNDDTPENKAADSLAEDRLTVGDWCLARGVELAAERGLPVKIHTGYLAGNGRMLIDGVRPGLLAPLLARYPKARFVLMHIGYPYAGELLALTKHFPNVWADMCWAWSIDPRASEEFVRRFIHTAPTNKLFAFGGDTRWPTFVVGFAAQARRGLRRALEAEVKEGDLTEREAIQLAERFMRSNQLECFDLERTRANIRAFVAS